MSLSGIYKNTKSLSGINQTTQDIANLYLTTANIYNANLWTDVANLKTSNLSSHTRITNLENANLNIQEGNLSSHTRITTLESKTQLLSSNALTSVFSGNLSVRSNVHLNNYIWNSCNIYSTSTPQLNFYGDSIDGYYGTIQFGSGDGASRATISTSLLSGNLSMSYGLSLSGWRVRQSVTDLLTVNTANTWVQGNLNVNANLTALGNQHFLSGNTTVQGNLIVGNVCSVSTQSFFLGNVGIGTTNAYGKLQVVGLSNIIGDETVSGSIGVGTTSASANIHVQNNKIFKDTNKNVLLNPSQGHILCYNGATNTEAHSTLCLRTVGTGGGCPHISFDRDGIYGWSLYQANNDSAFCIKSGWDMPTASTYLCMKIDTSRRFFIYGEPSIRQRFHAIGSYAGSYTSGNNINFSYTIQDIAGTSSSAAGILYLPNYAGYYTITCNGRITDGNATNGLYLYAGALNLFGTSDGVFWCTTDPSNRRCFSYSISRYLGSGNQVRAQFYASTTIDLCLISVVYHGIQN